MNIKTRLTKLESAAGTKAARVDGDAIRAEIHRLLTEEPETVEAFRMAAVAADCNLTLLSVAGTNRGQL